MTTPTTWTDYQIPTILIPGGGPVRGLSLDDIGVLMVNHLDTMMQITTLYIQSQKDIMASGSVTDIFMLAAREFPEFVSEVISVVTDTPDLRKKRLPVGIQIQIIQAAVKLTVEDVGGLGNLSAILQNAIKAAVAGRGEVSQKLTAILSPSSTTGAGKTQTS